MLRAILNTTINKNPGTTCARRPGQQEDLDVHVYICPTTSRKAEQLALFEEATAISTSAVVGLHFILPQPCQCGEAIAVIGSSRGPRYASIICGGCGTHRAWLSGATYNFISTIIDQFGRPVEPIELTLNSRTRVDNTATATER